jgi:hypothetical protein
MTPLKAFLEVPEGVQNGVCEQEGGGRKQAETASVICYFKADLKENLWDDLPFVWDSPSTDLYSSGE